VAGLREKVVSINDPSVLRESHGTISQTVVGEPLGARTTVARTTVTEDDADEMVVVDAPGPSRVTVDVQCDSSSGKDVYTVTVYIDLAPIHSFAGRYSKLERKLPNKKQPYGSLPKLWGNLPPSKTKFPPKDLVRSRTKEVVDNAQTRVPAEHLSRAF
jgi:hypothetical protein